MKHANASGPHCQPVATAALLLAAWGLLCPAGLSAAPDAEYAVRWNPAEGGPASAAETLKTLGLAQDDKDVYSVRYFDIVAPADLPPGYKAIGRLRQKGKKPELMLKYRGEVPVAMSALSAWACPLGVGAEAKDEVDVSFLAAGSLTRVHSRSCTLAGDAFPTALGAKPRGCVSTMTRLEAASDAGKVKVESWTLAPSGTTLLEVSRNGPDTGSAVDAFRVNIVERLLAVGIRPIERSKSEAGSTCD